MPTPASIGGPGQGTTSAAIAVPSGVVNGSKVVAYLSVYWAGLTSHTLAEITAPSGWTAATGGVARTAFGGYYWLTGWFWKDATGSDAGTYTFTASGAAGISGYALRITDSTAFSVSPFVDTIQTASSDVGGVNSVTLSSFTPGGANSLLLAGTISGGTVTATDWTAQDQDTLTDTNVMGLLSLQQTTAAALAPQFTGSGGYIHVTVATLRGTVEVLPITFTAERTTTTTATLTWGTLSDAPDGVSVLRAPGVHTTDGSGDAFGDAGYDPTTISGAAIVSENETSPYVDTGLTPGTSYTYAVIRTGP
jgi:hypothetical protein